MGAGTPQHEGWQAMHPFLRFTVGGRALRLEWQPTTVCPDEERE